jgi:hypothetical protein
MYIPNPVLAAVQIPGPVSYANRSDAIIKVLDLEFFRDFATAMNPSAQLPYHNAPHAKQVLSDAFFYMDGLKPGAPFLLHDDAPVLALACMFHDVGHSGGRLTDKENIEVALEYLASALEMSNDSYFESLYPEIEKVIRVTEYDVEKGFVREPDSDMERAIRDADLSSVFHAWAHPKQRSFGSIQAWGLFVELRDCGRLPPSTDYIVFLEQNARFLKDATFYTETGKLFQRNLLEIATATIRNSALKE